MKKLLILLLLASTVAAASLNDTQTEYMKKLTHGQPLQAGRDVYTDSMQGFFWVFIMSIVFVGIWLRTQNFTYPTLIVDIIWFRFGTMVQPEINYILYGINILVIGGMFLNIIRNRNETGGI